MCDSQCLLLSLCLWFCFYFFNQQFLLPTSPHLYHLLNSFSSSPQQILQIFPSSPNFEHTISLSSFQHCNLPAKGAIPPQGQRWQWQCVVLGAVPGRNWWSASKTKRGQNLAGRWSIPFSFFFPFIHIRRRISFKMKATQHKHTRTKRMHIKWHIHTVTQMSMVTKLLTNKSKNVQSSNFLNKIN